MNGHQHLYRHLESPRTDEVAAPPTWMLRGLRPISGWLVRRRYRLRVHGAEHVPTAGPVVIAGNHVGVIDGPLMAIFAPRPVHALTKIEMFDGKVGGLLTHAGQIPLDRLHTDPRAVRTSVRVLRDERVLGIFPEGTRGSGELDRFHRGAAYLALVTGAPVVPLVMLGTRLPGGGSSSMPPYRSRIDLVFGAPFRVDRTAWPRTRSQVGETSVLLRSWMLAHLEDAIRTTGLSLPGPLPAGQHEPDPGGGVTEQSA